MQIVICESKYPRKPSGYSVWLVKSAEPWPEVCNFYEVVGGEKGELLHCLYPQTHKAMADLTAKVWRAYLANSPEKTLEELKEAQS